MFRCVTGEGNNRQASPTVIQSAGRKRGVRPSVGTRARRAEEIPWQISTEFCRSTANNDLRQGLEGEVGACRLLEPLSGLRDIQSDLWKGA